MCLKWMDSESAQKWKDEKGKEELQLGEMTFLDPIDLLKFSSKQSKFSISLRL